MITLLTPCSVGAAASWGLRISRAADLWARVLRLCTLWSDQDCLRTARGSFNPRLAKKQRRGRFWRHEPVEPELVYFASAAVAAALMAISAQSPWIICDSREGEASDRSQTSPLVCLLRLELLALWHAYARIQKAKAFRVDNR